MMAYTGMLGGKTCGFCDIFWFEAVGDRLVEDVPESDWAAPIGGTDITNIDNERDAIRTILIIFLRIIYPPLLNLLDDLVFLCFPGKAFFATSQKSSLPV
jgi:hypothetical protein